MFCYQQIAVFIKSILWAICTFSCHSLKLTNWRNAWPCKIRKVPHELWHLLLKRTAICSNKETLMHLDKLDYCFCLMVFNIHMKKYKTRNIKQEEKCLYLWIFKKFSTLKSCLLSFWYYKLILTNQTQTSHVSLEKHLFIVLKRRKKKSKKEKASPN